MSFETDTFKLEVDANGNISSLLDKTHRTEYLPDGQLSPLLAIRVGGEYENPASASWDDNQGILSLTYPKNGATLLVTT